MTSQPRPGSVTPIHARTFITGVLINSLQKTTSPKQLHQFNEVEQRFHPPGRHTVYHKLAGM